MRASATDCNGGSVKPRVRVLNIASDTVQKCSQPLHSTNPIAPSKVAIPWLAAFEVVTRLGCSKHMSLPLSLGKAAHAQQQW